MQIYVVQKGDSMWLIAKKFGISLEALIKANPQIKDANKIFPGQKINVPVSGGGHGGMIVYTVRSGDTMWSIAKKFNISLNELIRANPQIKNPDRISVGQKVYVPVSGRGHGFHYTVVSGDTMWLIAKRFNVPLNDLIRANPQIKDPNRIYPGQVLFIPGRPPHPGPPPGPPPCPPQPRPPMGENNGRLYIVRQGDTFFNIAQRYALNLESLILANPQITNPNRLQPGMQIYLIGNHYVKQGETLFTIAQFYGVSLNELIRINPQIKNPDRIDVGQKIAIPRQPNGNIATYTVKQGDSLFKIAQKYNVTVEALMMANPDIRDPNMIFPGQRIAIPGPHLVQKGQSLFDIARLYGISLQALIRANPQIKNPDLIFPGQMVMIPPVGCRSHSGPPQSMCLNYVVQPGDTLFQIAAMYNVSLQSLIRANPQIKNPDLIFPGQVIRVPVGAVNFVTYVVKPGDTLFKIARMYGVPLQEVIRANPQIKNPDLIFPGQVIRIPVRTQSCFVRDEEPENTYESYEGYEAEENYDVYEAQDVYEAEGAYEVQEAYEIPEVQEDYAGYDMEESYPYQEEESFVADGGGEEERQAPCSLAHPIIYTVRKGDTLYQTASRHGVSVKQIMAANPGIGDPDAIQPGQQIIILPPDMISESRCLECPWFTKEID